MERVYKYKKCNDNIMYCYNIKISDENKKGGWYVQLISISAFEHKILNRWYDKQRKFGNITVFGKADKEDVEGWLRINKFLDDEEKYNVVDRFFDSVWDFYEYIGYNYKNKSVKQLDNLIMNWRN